MSKDIGLSEYEAFRLMDKKHQEDAMRKLSEGLQKLTKVDYIKANSIADKAVSTMHGHRKMVKKSSMDENMLRDRQVVLEDVIELMVRMSGLLWDYR
jgi:hypothetical protein